MNEIKKVYRIRRKGTDTFLTLGYNQKTNWSSYPTSTIDNNRHIIRNKEDFEVVLFEYKLEETKILNLR